MRVPLDEANVSLGLHVHGQQHAHEAGAPVSAPPLLSALHPNRQLLVLARGPVLSVLPVQQSGAAAIDGDGNGDGAPGGPGGAGGGNSGGVGVASARRLQPQPSYTSRGKESVTALAWLCVLTGSRQLGAASMTVRPPDVSELLECDCLLVGTQDGTLELREPGGRLIFRQRLHPGTVEQICVRPCSTGMRQDDPTEDVTITFPDALVRLPVLELRTHLKLLHLSRQAAGGSSAPPPLSYHRWDIPPGFGPRSGAVCLGVRPRGLDALLSGAARGASRTADQKLLMATGGSKPPLSGVEVQENPQRSTLAMIAGVAGSVTYAAAGAAYGAASKAVTLGPTLLSQGVRSLTSWVSGGADAQRAPAPPSYDLAGAPKPEPSVAWRPLTDDARRLGPLVPAPAGALLAAADGLGRVVAVDGASMVVLRMWKGYRDAQCGWALPPEGHPWAHHGLLLVLYAPRRDLVEVWAPRSGARVAAARADGPCRLLPVAPPCGGWRNDLMRRWLARGAPSTLVLRLGGRERGGVWDALDLAARP